MGLSVQEVIDELMKIEDKSLPMAIHSGVVFNSIRKVSKFTIERKSRFDSDFMGKTVVFLHRGEF